MVNFGPPNTVPDKFKQRRFYQHNPTVTLMRTTPDENHQLGEKIGRNAAAVTGSTAVLIPLRGISAIDQNGKTFDDPAARQALSDGIRATHGTAGTVESVNHVNDASFVEAVAERLLKFIQA